MVCYIRANERIRDFAVLNTNIVFGNVFEPRSGTPSGTVPADARYHLSFMLKEPLGDSPSFVQFADKVSFGYFDIVEKRLTKRRGPADELNRRCGHPFAFHIEK